MSENSSGSLSLTILDTFSLFNCSHSGGFCKRDLYILRDSLLSGFIYCLENVISPICYLSAPCMVFVSSSVNGDNTTYLQNLANSGCSIHLTTHFCLHRSTGVLPGQGLDVNLCSNQGSSSGPARSGFSIKFVD